MTRRLHAFLTVIAGLWLACGWICQAPARQTAPDALTVFDEVWKLVEKDFFDPQFNGVDWIAIRDSFKPRAIAATDSNEFASVMSEMLATLKTSHTAYLSMDDPRRYQLLGVFEFLASDTQLDLLEYEGIGIDTETIDGKVYVRSVYEGLPAHAAGILFGDEIVSVDGQPFQSISSFRDKSGQSVTLAIRRAAAAQPRNINVIVQHLNGRTMFETAMNASVRTMKLGDQQIAYVHLWSYAGIKYQEKLKELLLWGELSQGDALVLDLRDGWGGASLEYLNLFREPIVEMQSRNRDGEQSNFSGVWGKPVVLLVNGRSTSGKELFAFGFKKLKLGEIVGTQTAGAVVAGRPTLLKNGAVLYLAVSDLMVDGQRLEGRGVQPTVVVDRPIPYAAGADPQLEKALLLLQSD